MRDLTLRLKNEPGALAHVSETLGRAGVSIEGGGVFGIDAAGEALAHFLFAGDAPARAVLEAAGVHVVADREVLLQRLDQETPGQLGKITRAMADAGVNLDVMYSDHAGNLVLVPVDADVEKARAVSARWEATRTRGKAHRYDVALRWTGNRGEGTQRYDAYGRDHVFSGEGKIALDGSADAMFRGDRARWNPEELLVASLSACHMLQYLHLCADAGIVVTAYEDAPSGTLNIRTNGGGDFREVTLRPRVTLAPDSDEEKARALHHRAHQLCFIASSVRFPVNVDLGEREASPAGAR